MMPERLANQDAFNRSPRSLAAVVRSSPTSASGRPQRLCPLRIAIAREGGTADWTAGPKIVHYDRVVWTTMPDAATECGAADRRAGLAGTTPHDCWPGAQARGQSRHADLDPRGYTCMLRVNHCSRHSIIRRSAARCWTRSTIRLHDGGAGDDPLFRPRRSASSRRARHGERCRLDVSRPRDMAKVKADLKAAGYNGEKVVLAGADHSLAQKPLGMSRADMLQQAGMHVEYAAWIRRGAAAATEEGPDRRQGGWSAGVAIGKAIDWLIRPATQPATATARPRLVQSEKMGALRSQWLHRQPCRATAHLPGISRRCHSRKFPTFRSVSIKQPTAYRTGIPDPRRHGGLLECTSIMSTTAIFAAMYCPRKDGAQDVLRDHLGIARRQQDRARHARPGRPPIKCSTARRPLRVCRASQHASITASAKRWRRTPYEDGNGRRNNQSHRLYGAAAADQAAAPSCCRVRAIGDRAARHPATAEGRRRHVMEPFRNTILRCSTREEMGSASMARLSVLYV